MKNHSQRKLNVKITGYRTPSRLKAKRPEYNPTLIYKEQQKNIWHGKP